MANTSGIEGEAFKNVMATVAATVTVVTANVDEGPIGLTVSAFTSVSVDPPIVLVCIDKSTASLDAMLAASGYTVNLLPQDAGSEAMVFATHGADKFGTVGWRAPVTESAGPILEVAYSHLECVVVERTEMGDHWVLFGKVVAAGGTDSSVNPLVWHNRGFAHLTT